MNDIKSLLPHIKLRFQIENPDLEDVYLHGYESASNDISEEENPFVKGTAAFEHWLEGWWAGFYGEECLYDKLSDDVDSSSDTANAANDLIYHNELDNFFIKFLEITGVIALSAIVGYQLIELVA